MRLRCWSVESVVAVRGGDQVAAVSGCCRIGIAFAVALGVLTTLADLSVAQEVVPTPLFFTTRFVDSEQPFIGPPVANSANRWPAMWTLPQSGEFCQPMVCQMSLPSRACPPDNYPCAGPMISTPPPLGPYPNVVRDPSDPAELFNPSQSQGKTGTALDSLPSFRGIKGIKNLPGGVGTLLMANPHVGATWYPSQSTDQSGTSLGIDRYYFQAGIPIYHNETDTLVFTSHLDEMNIHTNAILPTSSQPFPKQLMNVALGANYFRQFANGNVGGIVLDVGSASDVPFHSSSEILASGTAFLLMPQDDHSAWFVGVNASTNSQVLYGLPIPGGGYFYHPSEDFQAIIGFPFSVISWKPSRDWQLQYVYAFLTTMHARAVYQPTNDWQLYAGFDWTNENWRRVDRPQSQDHFFYYEKRLAAGWLWWFAPNVGFEISGGWAFDRYFTEVDGFRLVGNNTVRIGSGPFLTAQFDVRF
ncbi:MAG: hypothetical protein JSS49_27315 [Planctomycetes bacterium]|nr:hypothetical protein [Planctomycetota bacterium]